MVGRSTTFEANQELLRALAESLTSELARLEGEKRDASVLAALRNRIQALQSGLHRQFEREHDHWNRVEARDPSTQRWIRIQIELHNDLDSRLRTLDEQLAGCADAASAPLSEWNAAARAIRQMTLHQLSEERLFQQSVLDESFSDR